VTIGGTEVSSCDYIARAEHAMSVMQTDDTRRAEFASGFGMVEPSGGNNHGEYFAEPIASGQSRDVVWRPRTLGILDMDSHLPISMCPGGTMELQLTWASDGKSCCNTSSGHGFLWNVSDLVVNVDVLTMDPTFLTSLSQHLYGGHALQMQFQNYHTTFNSLLSAAATDNAFMSSNPCQELSSEVHQIRRRGWRGEVSERP